ncbi:MAG: hypothetical protein H8E18_11080 [FCB group bacterium]|nr:hypothetical protein [FCB group bacterium]
MSFTVKSITILLIAIFLASCASMQPAIVEETPVETVEPVAEYFLNSSEYKLLLNPEMFGDYEKGFAEYWQIVQEVAAAEGIPILAKENPLKLSHKQVSFWDTEGLDLRKNSFLLRRKSKYKGGDIAPGYEFGLKFRQPDPATTLSKDLKMTDGYIPKFDRIELESDIVYYSAKNGAEDVTYAVSNSVQLDDMPSNILAGFAEIYPVLTTLGIPAEAELSMVAGVTVDEWMVKPGKLEFGDGLYGRMDMSVWIVETAAGELRIAEFSFDHDFLKERQYDAAVMERCTSFIHKLNNYQPEWSEVGRLKAAYLFD